MVSYTSLFTLATCALSALAIPVAKNIQTVKLQKRSFYDYDQGILRGVNLGGWFVLEPYMTPSLFEVFGDNPPVDEYHYTQTLGKEEALNRLEQHWSSFIVESDIESIAGLGLNFVRIPIGYWAFKLLDSDPYVQGQEKYLDQVLAWCAKYNLKAWIDLHGAPGSQNGFDNSGLRDSYDFQNGDNTNVHLEVWSYVFQKYGGSDYEDVVIGLELLNEPLGPALDMGKVLQFYSDGYTALRQSGSRQNIVFHDAFMAEHYFDNQFTVADDHWNVVIDHHHYQVFSNGELWRSIDDHVGVACQWGQQAKTEYHWNVCGEWSAALTDCAKWLNGVGRGARWDQTFYSGDNSAYHGSCDGSQDINSWDDTNKQNHRRYIEAQLDAFEERGGWVFWNWKTENALEWDLQKLTYYNIFPSPLTDRQYPGQCGTN